MTFYRIQQHAKEIPSISTLTNWSDTEIDGTEKDIEYDGLCCYCNLTTAIEDLFFGGGFDIANIITDSGNTAELVILESEDYEDGPEDEVVIYNFTVKKRISKEEIQKIFRELNFTDPDSLNEIREIMEDYDYIENRF